MENLVFPAHALAAMRRDGLTEDDVYAVIGDYDDIVEQDTGRVEYAREMTDGRYVVVVMEDDGVTLVTAWWHKRRGRRRRR
mgnify:CR=1 FL=1